MTNENEAVDLSLYKGPFDESHRLTFGRIDREMMDAILRLKAHLAEFDAYRHVWAEIAANNVAPGRNSDYCKRLEVMQGHALDMIDGTAWRLRKLLRGSVEE